MSVPQTIRKPNFHADVKTYGKIGERFFQDSISSGLAGKGKVIHDVSDNPFWQQYDVDFVISDEGVSLNSVDSELFDENLIRLEVKVDTVAPRTGNLAYEVISHGKFGWSINTVADKVIMLICNDGIVDGKIYAYEGHIIDMKKWKAFASYSYNCSFRQPNCIYNEEIYDFLFKIEDLKRNKIITSTFSINSWI